MHSMLKIILFLLWNQMSSAEINPRVLKMCVGDRVDLLPMGCQIIHRAPLVVSDIVFEKNRSDIISEKLSTIIEIHSGLVLRNNRFTIFNHMTSLVFLTNKNKDEPVLTFQNNPHLQLIEFPRLEMLKANITPVIVFDDDPLPTHIYSNTETLKKFMNIVDKLSGPIQCSSSLIEYRMTDDDTEETSVRSMLLPILSIFMMLFIVEYKASTLKVIGRKLYERKVARYESEPLVIFAKLYRQTSAEKDPSIMEAAVSFVHPLPPKKKAVVEKNVAKKGAQKKEGTKKADKTQKKKTSAPVRTSKRALTKITKKSGVPKK